MSERDAMREKRPVFSLNVEESLKREKAWYLTIGNNVDGLVKSVHGVPMIYYAYGLVPMLMLLNLYLKNWGLLAALLLDICYIFGDEKNSKTALGADKQMDTKEEDKEGSGRGTENIMTDLDMETEHDPEQYTNLHEHKVLKTGSLTLADSPPEAPNDHDVHENTKPGVTPLEDLSHSIYTTHEPESQPTTHQASAEHVTIVHNDFEKEEIQGTGEGSPQMSSSYEVETMAECLSHEGTTPEFDNDIDCMGPKKRMMTEASLNDYEIEGDTRLEQSGTPNSDMNAADLNCVGPDTSNQSSPTILRLDEDLSDSSVSDIETRTTPESEEDSIEVITDRTMTDSEEDEIEVTTDRESPSTLISSSSSIDPQYEQGGEEPDMTTELSINEERIDGPQDIQEDHTSPNSNMNAADLNCVEPETPNQSSPTILRRDEDLRDSSVSDIETRTTPESQEDERDVTCDRETPSTLISSSSYVDPVSQLGGAEPDMEEFEFPQGVPDNDMDGIGAKKRTKIELSINEEEKIDRPQEIEEDTRLEQGGTPNSDMNAADLNCVEPDTSNQSSPTILQLDEDLSGSSVSDIETRTTPESEGDEIDREDLSGQEPEMGEFPPSIHQTEAILGRAGPLCEKPRSNLTCKGLSRPYIPLLITCVTVAGFKWQCPMPIQVLIAVFRIFCAFYDVLCKRHCELITESNFEDLRIGDVISFIRLYGVYDHQVLVRGKVGHKVVVVQWIFIMGILMLKLVDTQYTVEQLKGNYKIIYDEGYPDQETIDKRIEDKKHQKYTLYNNNCHHMAQYFRTGEQSYGETVFIFIATASMALYIFFWF